MKSEFHFSELLGLLNAEFENSNEELFFAAPYMKTSVLEKFEIPSYLASKSIFVCRWRIEDLRNGSTDIGVYPLLRDQGIKVLLHPNLHAKYYRCDKKIFVGSANLTANGLLDDEFSSLEVLTTLISTSETENFERAILKDSTEINDDIYKQYLEILDSKEDDKVQKSTDFFWPSFTSFEEAWLTYAGNNSSLELKQLSIPNGLEKSKVKIFLKLRLREFSNIQRIESFLESSVDGRKFGEVRNLIRTIDDSIDETSIWQNLMSLLLDLYPERYEYFRPNHTEILIVKKLNS